MIREAKMNANSDYQGRKATPYSLENVKSVNGHHLPTLDTTSPPKAWMEEYYLLFLSMAWKKEKGKGDGNEKHTERAWWNHTKWRQSTSMRPKTQT